MPASRKNSALPHLRRTQGGRCPSRRRPRSSSFLPWPPSTKRSKAFHHWGRPRSHPGRTGSGRRQCGRCRSRGRSSRRICPPRRLRVRCTARKTQLFHGTFKTAAIEYADEMEGPSFIPLHDFFLNPPEQFLRELLLLRDWGVSAFPPYSINFFARGDALEADRNSEFEMAKGERRKVNAYLPHSVCCRGKPNLFYRSKTMWNANVKRIIPSKPITA